MAAIAAGLCFLSTLSSSLCVQFTSLIPGTKNHVIKKYKLDDLKSIFDDIDKTEFVKQTRLLYKTMYNNFGNAELMDEIQTMIKEEPDNDVNEYLNFVECLHSIENYQESDIDNPASIFTDKIKLIKDYLIKKATEAKELREAMDALSNSLGNLSNALDINTNSNSN